MADVVVEPVVSRRQKRQFIDFPWALYKGDPNWIPPLRGQLAELVNFKHHPFYDQNQGQAFLATRGGEVCGRIVGIVNQGHIDRYNERRGFFGFFDCVDDQQVANALFDAVRAWLAERNIPAMRGPTNPSLNYEVGLLIEGFDTPPTFMMTYNPPYYAKLFDNYGFRKAQDLLAFGGHISILPKIQEKLEPIAKQIIEHLNVKIRTMNTKRFMEDVETFLDLYNKALANTWGFVPMSPGEVRNTAKGLKELIVPEMAVATEIDGKVVGAVFCLPDYNPRIKKINGRLFPFGFLRLLLNKRAITKVRIISTNVLPEYHRMGLGLVLLHGLVPQVLKTKVDRAEFSWVLESNSLSRRSLEKGGAKLEKTYRVYDFDPA